MYGSGTPPAPGPCKAPPSGNSAATRPYPGLIAATADRNTFYTDMTRGADANHAYFTVGGTGDLHELVRPDAVSRPTVADLPLDRRPLVQRLAIKSSGI